MKNLTWQNPEQLFVAQVLINQVKSKCCGIKVNVRSMVLILMSGQKAEMSVLVIYAQKRIYLPHFDVK